MIFIGDENVQDTYGVEDTGFGGAIWYTLSIPGTVNSLMTTLPKQYGGRNFPDCTDPDIPGQILGEQRYGIKTIDLEDNDEDGLPDMLEVEGMFGLDKHTYYSDPELEDTDGDLLDDGTEMGQMYSVLRVDEDTVQINDTTILVSDVSRV